MSTQERVRVHSFSESKYCLCAELKKNTIYLTEYWNIVNSTMHAARIPLLIQQEVRGGSVACRTVVCPPRFIAIPTHYADTPTLPTLHRHRVRRHDARLRQTLIATRARLWWGDSTRVRTMFSLSTLLILDRFVLTEVPKNSCGLRETFLKLFIFIYCISLLHNSQF